MSRRCSVGGFVLAASAVLMALSVPAAESRPLVTTTVDIRQRGPRVPSSFLGFSQEYKHVPQQVGVPSTGVNQVTVGLFGNITRYGGGAPVYRVGGGSTDNARWSTGGPAPPGIDYQIGQPWVAGLGSFARATGAPLILGLNLGLGSPAIAADWARAALANLPAGSVRAFELGNEPDFYTQRPFGPGASPARKMRPRGYGIDAYLREFNRFARVLAGVRPRPRLAGPGLCCETQWMRAMPRILGRTAGRITMATIHRYPLFSCGKTFGRPGWPGALTLLHPKVIGDTIVAVQPVIRAARRYRRGLRITETNSVACGGARGGSDVFASALWGADWAFLLHAIGAKGADFHTASPLYQPFGTGWVGGRFIGGVKPLYFGMLLFAEATAHRSWLLPGTYRTTKLRTRAINVRLYAFLDPVDRVVRVAVLNKDARARGEAVIRIPAARGAATLKRLRAPGLHARQGVTWGGQSFSVPTTDGRLVGTPSVERVPRTAGGSYRFQLPPGSAALLTAPL